MLLLFFQLYFLGLQLLFPSAVLLSQFLQNDSTVVFGGLLLTDPLPSVLFLHAKFLVMQSSQFILQGPDVVGGSLLMADYFTDKPLFLGLHFPQEFCLAG